MKAKLFILFSFSIFFISCYNNEECKKAYIGTFKIDTHLISNEVIKNIVLQNRWDTVGLISNSNGEFYLLTNDNLLKECGGQWEIRSNDIEGNCSGYVKQKNKPDFISRMPFDIWIKIAGETYFLPYRKI